MAVKNIGEFELFTDKLIGKGAWGEVYHGKQKSLNRPVAIKILKKELTRDDDFVNRFKREAETLARMSDDHIIHVYSAGNYEDSCYFIMEYLEGQPLSSFIEANHKFSMDEIIYIAESVARALKAAWESPAKIVHRDIKPSNIMVASSVTASEMGDMKRLSSREISILKSKIKVMDFGLAKISETPPGGRAGVQDATVIGTVIGTPKYISPEQGLGNPADIRSDIYSLGIVLYEMAAGRHPFESESAVSMIRHHINDTAISPSQFNPSIPKDFENIILKAIQKEPERRYKNPEELLEDIIAFKQKQPPVHASSMALDATIISDITKKRRSVKKLIWTAVAGVVIIAIAGLFIILPKLKQNQEPIKTAGTTPVIITPPEIPTQTSTASTKPITPETVTEFTVNAWTDKEKDYVYKEGDVIKFFYKANKNCYVYLYYKDTSRNVKMIVPSGYNKNNYIKANQTYSFPDETMTFEIKVTPPFGTEELKVVASYQAIKDLEIKDDEKGFRDLGVSQNIDLNKAYTRNLSFVPKDARTETTCKITTTEKK
jgi:serine/threonine protein kinase